MTKQAVAKAVNRYLDRRYTVLFYSLLTVLAAVPALGAFGFSSQLLQYFLAVTLLAAAAGTGGRHRSYFSALAVVAICARTATMWFEVPLLAAVSLIVWTAIASVAAAAALRYAMVARRVGAEHLYAGLSAYLLAGHFFGVSFWAIEQAWPGSFAFGGVPMAPDDFNLGRAIYFSFVTLATLGYGDVIPNTELTRGIAIVEAITGQLYLAVMVARLVSLYAQKPGPEDGR